MTEPNPFVPPQSNLADAPSGEATLAGRGNRLGAVILDGLITGIPAFLALLAILHLMGQTFFSPVRGAERFGRTVLQTALTLAFYIGINIFTLKRDGQTLGKRLCGIRIARLDGSVPSLGASLGMRYVLMMALALVPIGGLILALVDPLLIFRQSRKCLHDELAGTVVLNC